MDSYQETTLDEDLIVSGFEEEPELLDEVMHPFNPTDIDIVVEPKSLDALIKRIQHNEIDMNTDFQRHAELWDNRKMSRLIESILIRFPLPAFYFDASDENNWLIVDGLQRLSTIRKFVLDKKLRLNGLEFLTELNGKTFDKLHRQYQRRIEECPVTVYMIKPGTPDDVKYSVFRRINTGGLTLNNQEIRNALAKPRDRELLEELANLQCSRAMLGDLSKRMKDQELVLRFWAFYRFDYLDPENKKEIASFLDKAMEDIKKGDEQYRENFKKQYSTAIERCYQLLDKSGFEKDPTTNSRRRSKNSTLFEVWMIKLAKITESDFNTLLNNKLKLRDELNKLLKDSEFLNAITYSTHKKDHVVIRYEKIENLIQMVLHD
ncbi:DUF262 domain-containing protein [Pseudomonas sp. MAG002Y]|uniref:DUF262 domain-containing protein n=1 Tax=Pseudomonas sp. MAG002Y TaxID=2678690 RepID=UPI001C610D91|nr:DUF262 domain-containing protein [Pseudomonas sp. MAG002Y]MBW5414784.1 DUF262 domain-containing protein [Pseudomonas sp. MAG002Y]